MKNYALGLVAFALFTLNAYAQEVKNPLYSMQDKNICSGLYNSGKIKEHTPLRVNLLEDLGKSFPLSPKADELDLSYIDLLKKRLAPHSVYTVTSFSGSQNNPTPSKITELGPQQYSAASKVYVLNSKSIWEHFSVDPKSKSTLRYKSPSELYKDNANDWRFRRSLLRVFEAAYSGGVGDFQVSPLAKSAAPKRFEELAKQYADLSMALLSDKNPPNLSSWQDFTQNYRPLKNTFEDEIVIILFLEDIEEKIKHKAQKDRGVFAINCTENGESPPRSTQTLQKFRKKLVAGAKEHTYKNNKETKYKITGKWRWAEDSDGFVDKSDKGASLSFEIDENKESDGSVVMVDAALGYSLTLKREGNIHRSKTITPFVSIQQDQQEVTVFDFDNMENGFDPEVTKEASFALADVLGGLRFDNERKSAPCTRTANSNCGLSDLEWSSGRQVTYHAASLELAVVTDNYLDQQGFFAEASYTPGFLLNRIPNYRQNERLFWTKSPAPKVRGNTLNSWDVLFSTRFNWDLKGIIDHKEFARAPRDHKTPQPADRKTNSDASRYGFDFNGTFSWNNIFSIPADKARVEASFKYDVRDRFEGDGNRLWYFETGIKLTDTQSGRYTVGFKRWDGHNFLTEAPREGYGIELAIKN